MATAAEPGVPLRTWKDASGKFQVQASLVRMEGDQAILRRADGKEVKVSIDRLSAEDRGHLRSLLAEDPFELLPAEDGAALMAADESAAALAAAGRSVVIVAQQRGDDVKLGMGYVFHADGERAYVFTRRLEPVPAVFPASGNMPSGKPSDVPPTPPR